MDVRLVIILIVVFIILFKFFGDLYAKYENFGTGSLIQLQAKGPQDTYLTVGTDKYLTYPYDYYSSYYYPYYGYMWNNPTRYYPYYGYPYSWRYGRRRLFPYYY